MATTTNKQEGNQEPLKDEIMNFEQLFEVQGGLEPDENCGLGCFTNGVLQTGTGGGNGGGNGSGTNTP
jgi:hypothetical protein